MFPAPSSITPPKKSHFSGKFTPKKHYVITIIAYKGLFVNGFTEIFFIILAVCILTFRVLYLPERVCSHRSQIPHSGMRTFSALHKVELCDSQSKKHPRRVLYLPERVCSLRSQIPRCGMRTFSALHKVELCDSQSKKHPRRVLFALAYPKGFEPSTFRVGV